MKRPTRILPAFGYALTAPSVFIWLALGLRVAEQPLGETLAAWLRANFSEYALVVMWLGFPAIAMVLGLAYYAIGGNKAASIGLVALSSLLIVLIALAATLRVS